MRVRREHLEWSVRLIGRSLMTPSPDYANSAFNYTVAIQTLETKKGILPEQWFRIERMTYSGELQVGYILVTDHKAGQFLRALPADVDPTTAISFSTDWTVRPVTGMARCQHQLISTLLTDPKKALEPDDEFVATEADKKRIAALLLIFEGMIEASNPEHELRVVAASKARVFPLVEAAINARNLRAPLAEIGKLADESEAKRTRIRMALYLVRMVLGLSRYLHGGRSSHAQNRARDGRSESNDCASNEFWLLPRQLRTRASDHGSGRELRNRRLCRTRRKTG